MLGLIVIGLSTSVIWGVSAMLLKQAAYSAGVLVLGTAYSVWRLMGLVGFVVGWGATKLIGSYGKYNEQAKKRMKEWGQRLCFNLLATVSLGLLVTPMVQVRDDAGNIKKGEYKLGFDFNKPAPFVHRAKDFLDYTGLSKKKPIILPKLEDLEKNVCKVKGISYKKERYSNFLHQVDKDGNPIKNASVKEAPKPILFTALEQTLTLKEEFSMAAWVIDQMSKEDDKFKQAVFGPKKRRLGDEV
jgi:hypothetical protein